MLLWQLLEDASCWAGVRAAWRRWLGDDTSLVERWLRPREELAMSLPVVGGGRLRVVEHADHDVVAVDDETDVAVEVEPEDRVIFELHEAGLVRDLATALELAGEPEQVSRRVWRLGYFVPIEGARFPVFLALARNHDELVSMAGNAAARSSGPFILAVSTDRWISEPLRSLLRDRQSASLTLERAVTVGADGFAVVRPLASHLPQFMRDHVPTGHAGAHPPRFQTPKGSRWSDVTIRFEYTDKVRIRVADATATLTCADMGLAKKSSRERTVLWDLLHEFAKGHGRLDWSSRGAGRHRQKQRERLAARLRTFFVHRRRSVRL